jgi:glycosyltransferase involved in cell wall biosynthesis
VARKPGFLFVLPWSITVLGGVNEVVKNLYRKVQENGEFEAAILENAWEPERISPLKDWVVLPIKLRGPWEGPTKWKVPLAFLIYLPSNLVRLTKLCREYKVRVFNPHFPNLSCLHFLFLRWFGLFRGAIILSFHGSDVRALRASRGFEKFLWRFALSRVDHIIACSNELASRVVGFAPRVKDRITVIWNGIDPMAMRNEGLTNGSLPLAFRQCRFILCVANFVDPKAHDVLIEAYRRVIALRPDCNLVLIGRPGPTSQAICGLISSYRMQDRVLIVESVPHSEIATWMAAAELFVLPSRSESFPMVILEAGFCGKAVVATAVGGIPEILTDGVTGRLVPPEDPNALSRVIVEMLDNPSERLHLGLSLQEHVKTKFTWQRAYERYAQVYREIRPVSSRP